MSRLSKMALRGGVVVTMLAGGVLLAGAAWQGGPGCHGEVTTEAELRQHLDRGSARMLARVDASDEQVDRVDALVDAAAPSLFALKQEGTALRERGLAAMEAEPLDRVALDAVRRDGLALADRASAEVLDLLVDVGEVLTAEQRQELRGWRH